MKEMNKHACLSPLASLSRRILIQVYRSFSRDVISFPVAILVYNFRLRNTSVIGHNYHAHQ